MTIQFAPRWTDATTNQTCIVGNATDTASAAASTLLDLRVNNVSKFVVNKFGALILTSTARTSGSDSLLNLIAPADTTRAAGVEATDINFNLARTVQFAAGNITNQRAVRIQAPTYSFASASTITNASTLAISGPPTAGTNATLTNAWALNVESGRSYFYSPIFMGDVASPGTINLQSATYTYKLFNSWPDAFFIAENNRTLCRLFGGTNNQSGSYTAGWLMAPQMTLAWAASEPVLSGSAGDVIIARDTSNTLAQRNATNSQTFRLYNTFTDASNHERLALQFGTFSSARHAQIAAESAGTGTANINLVLTPKGTGAFILGPPPDGTATGGNARGANSVDLQTSRTSASQVCSSPNSIIAGQNNTSTGSGGDAVFGVGNVSSNATSLVSGSTNTVSSYSTICTGAFSTVSGHSSATFGFNHTNAGNLSICAGNQHTIDSASSYGVVFGNQGRVRLTTQAVHACGQFASVGDCQWVRNVLRGKTTTNAAVELVDPTRFVIPAGFIFHGTVKVSGAKSDGSAVAAYERQVRIKRVGNTTTLVGAVNTIGTDETAGTSIAITADDANESAKIEAAGVLNETWRWEAVIEGGLYAYGT